MSTWFLITFLELDLTVATKRKILERTDLREMFTYFPFLKIFPRNREKKEVAKC
jgi:hypothetical protein